MIRRMLLLSLFATVPALVCAQEARLINCRSLDAAGNFVGPDEVVVDDLVCQKVKSGATTATAPKPEPPKPLPGAVISDEEPPTVVDAAKASAKRVAAAVQANAGKSTAPSDSSTAASPAPPAPAVLPEATKSSVAPENSEVQPMGVAEAARANAKRMAEAQVVTEKPASTPGAGPPAPSTPVGRMPFSADAAAKPQLAKISKADRAELTEPAIAPAGAPAESALMKAAPAPAAPLPAPKGPAPIEATQVPAGSAPAVEDSTAPPAIAPAGAPAESALMKAAPAPAAPLPAPKGPAPIEATQVPAGSAPAVEDSTAPPPTEIVIMSAPSREAAAPPPEGKDPDAASASTPEPVSPQTEIVITSAPSREAAAPPTAPESAAQPAAEAKPDTVASTPPSTEAVKAPATDAQPPASEAPSAFYDANAAKNSSNRPAVTLGVVSSPAGAVASPADEPPANTSANATTEASPAAPEAAPAAQPDAQPVWPGNAEPNLEREKVVETGSFALPKEVPDPNPPLHSKQITPSAEDGFQEGQRADCRKNITIGGLKGEKLVLGTPKWAADWIEKNQKRMLDVCFSDTPMQGARNYLIVFYAAAPVSDGAEVVNPVAPPPQGGSPAAGVGTFTTSYGSTWHYFFDRNVGVTVNSSIDADQPQSQPDKLSYATAYTEEGVPVAQHWQGTPKKQIKLNPDDPNVRKESKKERHAREEMEHVSDSLLNQMVEEIEKL